jgi:ketosteroid isomerase-like protein
MSDATTTPCPPLDPGAVLDRLHAATNARDLEGVVACFAPTYRNETPAHPGRGFVGRDQVRTNWQHIFAAIPDIRAEVVRSAVSGETVWSEWEHRGTRPDGSQHLMRGVIVFGVTGHVIAWARFYLEPVQADQEDADDFRNRQLRSEAES